MASWVHYPDTQCFSSNDKKRERAHSVHWIVCWWKVKSKLNINENFNYMCPVMLRKIQYVMPVFVCVDENDSQNKPDFILIGAV